MDQAISLRFLNMQAFFEAFRIRYFTILVEVFENIILVEYIFDELYRVSKTQDKVFKPANKYQIIRQCHK